MSPSDHIANVLLHEAHPAELASAIFKDKVLHKPLRLRPTSPDPTSQDARAQRRRQRLRKEAKGRKQHKVKCLSAKEKRNSGIYELSDEVKRYEIYVPLHQLWIGYMWEILGMGEGMTTFVTAQNAGSKLASADYHGAEITVVRSTCASLVGLSGIVIKDTKFTFQLISKKNELKTIPKRHTVFKLVIPQASQSKKGDSETKDAAEGTSQKHQDLIFELYGSQLETRATDRATKKFKQRYIPNL